MKRIKERNFLKKENECKFILTKNKLEKNKDRWMIVEKQTLPSIFNFEEAIETVKRDTFEGKYIKVDFDVLRINKENVVRHFSGKKIFGGDI